MLCLGMAAALSAWNPPTPERRGRRRGAEVPGNVAFGKPSGLVAVQGTVHASCVHHVCIMCACG